MINSLKLNTTIQVVFQGALATLFLLILYFTIVSLVSGWIFAQDQFSKFWYFIVALALGFGIQVGQYFYLKEIVKRNVPKGMLATTGTISTAAMVSCCAHYLANILPALGAAGAITLISQYQVQLFWFGLAFNFIGITYMAGKIYIRSQSI